MTTAWIILTTIACYFALLVWLSWLRGRRADNAALHPGLGHWMYHPREAVEDGGLALVHGSGRLAFADGHVAGLTPATLVNEWKFDCLIDGGTVTRSEVSMPWPWLP